MGCLGAGAERLDEDAALRQVAPRPAVASAADGGHVRIILHAVGADADENAPSTDVSSKFRPKLTQ